MYVRFDEIRYGCPKATRALGVCRREAVHDIGKHNDARVAKIVSQQTNTVVRAATAPIADVFAGRVCAD